MNEVRLQHPWTGWHQRDGDWYAVNQGDSWKETLADLQRVTKADQRYLQVLATGTDPNRLANGAPKVEKKPTRQDATRVGVLRILKETPSSTRELADALNRSYEVVCRIVHRLQQKGIIRDSGGRRGNKYNPSILWELQQAAEEKVA